MVMKRVLFAVLCVLFSIVSVAQDTPKWIKKTPKPNMFNRTFFYQVVTVHVDETDNEAAGETEAIEKATQLINDNILEYIGNSREVIYKDGQPYYKSREGQSIRWPINRKCQWHNPSNKSEWLFLYQIARIGHVKNYRFDDYDCQKKARKIYWTAGIESFFVPGLGQIVDKKDYLKGACFFAGTAACIIGGLISDSYYQWNYNEAIKLHPGSEQDSYLDKADQWNKAEYGFFIAAGLCWAVNICDALFAPPKYSVTPYIDDKSMSLSLNVKF